MAHWLSLFSNYNFVVHYKPGKNKILADTQLAPQMTTSELYECAVCTTEELAAVEVAATSPLRET